MTSRASDKLSTHSRSWDRDNPGARAFVAFNFPFLLCSSVSRVGGRPLHDPLRPPPPLLPRTGLGTPFRRRMGRPLALRLPRRRDAKPSGSATPNSLAARDARRAAPSASAAPPAAPSATRAPGSTPSSGSPPTPRPAARPRPGTPASRALRQARHRLAPVPPLGPPGPLDPPARSAGRRRPPRHRRPPPPGELDLPRLPPRLAPPRRARAWRCARRLGFLSALRGPSWLLPDPDLSEQVFSQAPRRDAPRPRARLARPPGRASCAAYRRLLAHRRRPPLHPALPGAAMNGSGPAHPARRRATRARGARLLARVRPSAVGGAPARRTAARHSVAPNGGAPLSEAAGRAPARARSPRARPRPLPARSGVRPWSRRPARGSATAARCGRNEHGGTHSGDGRIGRRALLAAAERRLAAPAGPRAGDGLAAAPGAARRALSAGRLQRRGRPAARRAPAGAHRPALRGGEPARRRRRHRRGAGGAGAGGRPHADGDLVLLRHLGRVAAHALGRRSAASTRWRCWRARPSSSWSTPTCRRATSPTSCGWRGKRRAGSNYGTSGGGGINHFVTEYFCLRAGIRMTAIPYRGTAPAVTDLVAGNIRVMITTVASASGADPRRARAGDRRDGAGRRAAAEPRRGADGARAGARLRGLHLVGAAGAARPAAGGARRHPRRRQRRARRARAARASTTARARARRGAGPEELPTLLKDELARWREVAQAAGIRAE